MGTVRAPGSSEGILEQPEALRLRDVLRDGHPLILFCTVFIVCPTCPSPCCILATELDTAALPAASKFRGLACRLMSVGVVDGCWL